MNHLIYTTFGEQEGNVYSTQVKELLNYWSLKDDWKVTLIQISDNKNFKGLSSKVEKIYIKRKFRILIGLHEKAYVKYINNLLKINDDDTLFFNSRGVFSFSIITKYQQIKKINPKCNNLDIRGTIEEFKISKIRRCIYPYFKMYFIKALKSTKSITVVTSNLKEHLINDFNIDFNKIKIGINPTLSILKREVNTDRKNLAYIGKIAWIEQNKFKEEMIKIINLFSNYDWSVDMIGNTSDTLGLENMGLNLVPRMTPQELSKYITQFHTGIVLRDDTVINKVAAPCKISDYLCLGMPIIYSGEIGSLKDFLLLYPNYSRYMININELVDKSIIYDHISINSMELDQLSTDAQEYFGVKEVIDRYIDFFHKDV